MNRYLIALAVLFTAHTHAASTVELTVTGLITPMACTPLLSGGGHVDLGKISQKDLNQATGTRLPLQYLTLTVSCNAAARFALRMRDNRDGTAHVNSEIYYGLGLDAGGNKLGVYSVSFDPKQTVVDSLPQIYGTESTTGGVAWRTSNTNPIDIGSRSLLGFTDVAGSVAGPSAIQNLSSRLTLEAVINARQNLDLSTDTPLDGSATLEVVYL
ncbi:MAG: Protein GltF [Pseudomonas sp.]|nr:MAG: Protein GltF [Pseudomonas sp.]